LDNLYAIIKSVKPRRVLLTSYTFSADWFESTLYPLFRQDDCEAIVVMADAREAYASVDNTKSQFGGSRYRVIGATGAPGGIFHPKFAYLETGDGDILVIGSGNLTAAGQGGQLEVLDAVSATVEPEVFIEFSQFLSQVAVVANLAVGPERDSVSYFARRALAQSKAYPRLDDSTRTAFLVSSLGTSAGAKLVQLVKKFVPTPTVLTVLSPYHDKDVRAARRLQSESQSKKIRYALGQTADGDFLAPFADKLKQDRPKHFVTPNLTAEKGPTRPLHAKWFDVCNESGETVSMTGSVNATYKSLWTTDNVELALARVFSGERTKIWKAVKGPPTYKPCEFPSTIATDTTVLCKANLSLASVLEVEFRPRPAAGPLKIRLFQGRATHYEVTGLHYLGGAVTLTVPAGVAQSLRDGALWVAVEGVDAEGEVFNCQSWVNVEQELERKPSEVDLNKAMNRLEHGSYDYGDEYLLLAAIHFELTGRKLNRQGAPAGRSGTHTRDEPTSEMTEAELAENHNNRGVFGGENGPLRILRMLQLLVTKSESDDEPLLGGDEEPWPTDDNEDADHQLDDEDGAVHREPGDNQAEKRKRKKERDAIEAAARAKQTLEDAIKKAFSLPMSEAKANWLIPYELGRDLQAKFPRKAASHVGIGANVGRTLLATVRRCANSMLEPSAKQNLLPTLACAAAGACLAYKRLGEQPPYDEVLSMLEDFAERQITCAELQTLPSKSFPGKPYVMLDAYEWSDLLPELANIGQALRLGGRIDQLLQFALSPAAPRPSAITAAEESFIKGLKVPRMPRYKVYAIVTEASSSVLRPGCPQCHQRLSDQEARRLQNFHIAMCEASCRRPIIVRTKALAQHQFYKQEEAYIAPERQEPKR
jgi:hypothetical protein